MTGFFRGLAIHLVISGVALSGPQYQPQAPVGKFALLVGVNEYDRRGFSPLRFAEQDAIALGTTLRHFGFTAVVLTGSAQGAARATRSNVDSQIHQLLEGVKRDDIVLLAFSGHGQQLSVKRADGTEYEDSFYCPVDAVVNEPPSSLSLSYLFDDILSRKGGRNLVLVDACRDLPADPGRGAKGVQGRVVALPEDTAVLFSCRAGQQSFESAELGHGIFTHCVLQGLRLDSAQPITWSRLVTHVEESMAAAATSRLIPEGRRQSPIAAGGVGRLELGMPIRALTQTKPTIEPDVEPETKSLGPYEGTIAGERWTNEMGMSFQWCPPGRFTMGSPETETDRYGVGYAAVRKSDGVRVGSIGSEKQAEVTLQSGFWLGSFEVKQSDYEAVVGVNPCWYQRSGGGSGKVQGIATNAFPVESVTWNDAIAFLTKLEARERTAGNLPLSWTYALPTEAQWEYACRAGTTTRTAFGDTLSTSHANFNGGQPSGSAHDRPYLARPTTCGTYRPNAWGIFDMHGNVFEWCSDGLNLRVTGEFESSPNDPTARIVRGGSWGSSGKFVRSAYRYGYSPTVKYGDLGFRVAIVRIQPVGSFN